MFVWDNLLNKITAVLCFLIFPADFRRFFPQIFANEISVDKEWTANSQQTNFNCFIFTLRQLIVTLGNSYLFIKKYGA